MHDHLWNQVVDIFQWFFPTCLLAIWQTNQCFDPSLAKLLLLKFRVSLLNSIPTKQSKSSIQNVCWDVMLQTDFAHCQRFELFVCTRLVCVFCAWWCSMLNCILCLMSITYGAFACFLLPSIDLAENIQLVFWTASC